MQAHDLSFLNPVQRTAVTSTARQLMLVAGAGSGKTAVLVNRIAWLIREGHCYSGEVLAVTFTNKAAKEMTERLQHLLGGSLGAMWVGTFHGICFRILRENTDACGLPPKFQIIDTEDARRLVKRFVKEMGLDEDRYDPKLILGFIHHWKEEGRRSNAVPNLPGAEFANKLAIYQKYEQHCQSLGLVDFSELLLRTLEVFQNRPDVLARYQRFTTILVDEFQDTNTIQYRWLHLLATPEHRLTVVGDDDQSIYGWRGAKVENMQQLLRDYPKTELIRLEQNYRSTKTILEVANTLIERNKQRMGKVLWSEGAVGDKVSVYQAFDEMDEARWIARMIQEWQSNGGTREDIAILYRSNAQSRVLEQVFRQAKIPYRIYGGLRFFERAEIKDILCYLRLVAMPQDDTAFDRVVNVPARGLGEKTIEGIRAMAQVGQCSLWEAAHHYARTATSRVTQGIQQFVSVITALQAQQSDLPDLVKALFHQHGMYAYYENLPGEKLQGKVENLQEFLNAAIQYAEAHQGEPLLQLQDFLAEVVLEGGERAGGNADEEVSAVQMMTLHSAKGLEFPCVFIGGLEEGLFPHRMSAADPQKLEEERRLCYVGITRAKKKLHLSYSLRRAFSGHAALNQGSRFLEELPSHLLHTVDMNKAAQPQYGSGQYGGAKSYPSARPSYQSYSNPAAQARPQTMSGVGSGAMARPKTVSGDKGTKIGEYTVGQRVYHHRFGEGTILGGDGAGDKARIHVQFKTSGAKWLVLSFTQLEPR
ncbi:MAG: UvrD-helicase domain-containing protein [Pseudomonadota bacterium]